MSSAFGAGEWEVDVDNPGHGELYLEHRAMDWSATLRGGELGRLLREVTTLALSDIPWPEAGARPLVPSWCTPGMARQLLPQLQCAVVLATAGTDRFELTFIDEGERPPDPLCVNCNLGSVYHQAVTESKACEESGHRAFGWDASLTWERVAELYKGRVESWEFRRSLESIAHRAGRAAR